MSRPGSESQSESFVCINCRRSTRHTCHLILRPKYTRVGRCASADASIYINNSPTVGNIVSGASTNSGVFWTQDQVIGLSGAAPAIDAKLATTFLHTNSGANPTFANPIWSGYPGYGHITIQLILTEDATGNHVYAFGSKFLFTSAFVQPGVGSASKKTLLAFTFNGANWIQVGSTNVWY